MKTKILTVAIIFLFTLAALPSRVHAASDSIQWYGYERGMALGKKESKKVFLHFWAEWCTYCKKMEKKTFRNSSVIAYLNKHFIAIKVNTDKEKELAGRFGIRGVPDSWFVDENGQEIGNRSGYIPVKIFLPFLKFIHTDSYKKMSYGKFLLDM